MIFVNLWLSLIFSTSPPKANRFYLIFLKKFWRLPSSKFNTWIFAWCEWQWLLTGFSLQTHLPRTSSVWDHVHTAGYHLQTNHDWTTEKVWFNSFQSPLSMQNNFLIIFRLFESVVKYFDAFLNMIPLSFVLGFYVSYVASRWWQQFLAIPWPDKSFHTIACYIPGFDEESRMLRRSLLRWMNLAMILVLRSISSAVKQRFPTLDHVVEAGSTHNL